MQIPVAPDLLTAEDLVGARLRARIDDAICAAGGWIPFSRFMAMALYEPGLGYYSAGALKVGRDPRAGSDFVTAPELSPLFARVLARPIREVLDGGGRTILELGGGSGRLAADLLLELEVLDALPDHYLLLDVSADFRDRQAATIARDAPHLIDRVQWLETLPAQVDGVIVANEVLDAVPVELVCRADAGWSMRGVALDRGTLRFADRPASAEIASAVAETIPDDAALATGYVTEIHPQTTALVRTLTERLSNRSAMLLIDYGFPASEYYHPQRASGTLMAHRRHRASVDVLDDPGSQDLTAHVDFSGVARAAREAGGVVIGYASQSAFLIDCGIADLLSGAPTSPRTWAPQAAALQTLLSEAEMGELFKVIGIARGNRSLSGFRGRDRRDALFDINSFA